jgi:hypothetical protein
MLDRLRGPPFPARQRPGGNQITDEREEPPVFNNMDKIIREKLAPEIVTTYFSSYTYFDPLIAGGC